MGTRHDLGHQSAIAHFLAVCAQLTVTAFLAPPEDDGQHLVQRVFFVSVFAILLASPLLGRLKPPIFTLSTTCSSAAGARSLYAAAPDWSSLVRPAGSAR